MGDRKQSVVLGQDATIVLHHGGAVVLSNVALVRCDGNRIEIRPAKFGEEDRVECAALPMGLMLTLTQREDEGNG